MHKTNINEKLVFRIHFANLVNCNLALRLQHGKYVRLGPIAIPYVVEATETV